MSKKVKERVLKLWAFQDKLEGFIYPPDICPFFSRRTDARIEKDSHPVYYDNTKIVKVKVLLTK